jgi:hypothetical protein
VIVATIIMSIFVSGINIFIPGDFLKLIAGLILGPAIYLFAAYLLKIEELKEVQGMVQKLINKAFVRT